MMSHRTTTLLGCLALAAAGCSREAPPPPEATTTSAPFEAALPAGSDAATQAIDADEVLAWTSALSDDRFEGRGPGTAGDVSARHWIAARLAALGLEPAGTDAWEQPLDIVSVTAEVPKSWVFRAPKGEIALEQGAEFVAFSGVQAETASVEDAELVFVGYGIDAPEYAWDDFDDVDVSGRVLLVLNNDPDWSPDLFEGERRLYYGRWTYKYEQAAAKGAAGAIILHTTQSAGYPWQVVQSSWAGPQSELPAGDEPRIQVGGWVTEAAGRRILELAGRDLDALVESARSREFRPLPLGITTSLHLRNGVERTQTANVLGVLPGSDPGLAAEHVVYGAHHDHLGRGAPNAAGDDIYNGALDNALGVAEVLAVAKAFTALPAPPRRSILFAFWGGEEQGLIGSRYFAAHPTVPPGRLAANLNVDGGNTRGRTRDVVFVGYGKSDLDALVEGFAAEQGRRVVPDPFPDRGFFYRSDQFSLAKVGVPAIYLDSGTDFVGRPEGWGRAQIEAWEAEHYHQPSDEVTGEWNLEGLVEDARLLFRCGLAIAQAEALPAWKAGDEFEAARRAALAARSSAP
jgi:Zn-dependent M28 family amino/carboxypeptidase